MTNLSMADLRAANLRDRRERIATAVFQALLSKPEVVASPHEIAACAANYADVLIALLDREPPP